MVDKILATPPIFAILNSRGHTIHTYTLVCSNVFPTFKKRTQTYRHTNQIFMVNTKRRNRTIQHHTKEVSSYSPDCALLRFHLDRNKITLCTDFE